VKRWLVLAALLGGCWTPRVNPYEEALRKLQSSKEEEHEEGFQALTQAGPWMLPRLKALLGSGARRGFPVAALLYTLGEGDAVPLEVRVRHLAAFEWPRSRRTENAIIEPYAWNEIERDVARAGRPALRLLAEAVAKESPGEAKAMQAVRAMLRIGGREAAVEFARLLEVDRGLGGVRVCDVAAAALLHMGRQDLLLRRVDRVEAARAWWAKAKDQPEPEWIREAAAGLVARWQPKDPEGVRPVLELLAGEELEDPKAWWERNPDWRPAGAPLRPAELLPGLSAGRARAWAANRRLEEATGARLDVPRVERVSELAAALRLWRPAPDLAVRWRRFLESASLRLSIIVVGYHPERKANHVLWAFETYFHSVEDESGELRTGDDEGAHLLFAQSRDLGTRLAWAEYSGTEAGFRRLTREVSAERPLVVLSEPLKACVVASIEETASRRAGPKTPELFLAEARAKLREAAGAPGEEGRRALRGLGYCQDASDADFLREREALEALLLLGDPAGIGRAGALLPHELEMALRKAGDPQLRQALEAARSAGRP
jgi:hypothetical protein